MLRTTILFCSLIMSLTSVADTVPGFYQIDMIVFAHQQNNGQHAELFSTKPSLNNMQHAIPLQFDRSNLKTPYHLLPSTSSQLNQEYWTLNHKSDYKVLFHYTWLQPNNNQQAIFIPPMTLGNWSIEGTLRIRQSNYYVLDTNLVFSTPKSKKTAFVFSQQQRMKPGTVYYLDHPMAGMLIKVHQVA